MKKFLVAIMFGFMAIAAQAEASFDQIQGLIQQGQYQAAEQGLEVIIKNHPQSAKAFYAMAQAQAGLGNLEKAKKALDIATGLNPTLDFAPASSVASLREAITPQVKKIEAVETSHFWVNFAYFALFAGFAVACYFLYSVYARKRDEDEGTGPFASNGPKSPTPDSPAPKSSASSYASSYVPPARPAYRGPTQTFSTPPAPTPAPQPTTTVVNNNSGGNDMLTGVLIGNMLSSHHDTTRVVEREVIRETPAPSRDSSWDDTPSRSSSRSSSWDDDSSSSSSSRSSSWDDSSSSSRSSSWDSSSSSDSSSSWSSDSSSSSSSSDW